MSSYPNIAVIDRMTQAIVENDREALKQIFTNDEWGAEWEHAVFGREGARWR